MLMSRCRRLVAARKSCCNSALSEVTSASFTPRLNNWAAETTSTPPMKAEIIISTSVKPRLELEARRIDPF